MIYMNSIFNWSYLCEYPEKINLDQISPDI